MKIAEIVPAMPTISPSHETETEEAIGCDVLKDTTVEEVMETVSKTSKPKSDLKVRPRRQAAVKQRQLINDLVDASTLAIKIKDTVNLEKPPMHAFDYNEWVKMLEDDDDKFTFKVTEQTSVSP
jgi:hypothetical protein